MPIRGHLRLSATPYFPSVRLRFPRFNRIEIVLRNSEGKEVFRHSDGQSELPANSVVEAGSTWSVPFSFAFAGRDGIALPDGEYTVTAWLQTDDPEPRFKAEAVLRVGSVAPAQ